VSNLAGTQVYGGLLSTAGGFAAQFGATQFPGAVETDGLTSGGMVGGFFPLTGTATGNWGVKVDTAINMTGLGVVVAQFLMTGNAVIPGQSRFNLGLPFAPYQFNTALNINFATRGGNVALVSPGTFNALAQGNNTLTSAACRVIRAPSNLAAVAAARNLTLTWDAPADVPYAVVKYVVYYRRVAGQANADPTVANAEVFTVVDVTGGATTLVVPNLQPFINYEIKVLAWTPQASGFNATLIVKTLAAAPTGAPNNFTATALSPNMIQLSWQPVLPYLVNGPLLQFDLRYDRLEDSSANRSDTNSSGSFVVIVAAGASSFVFNALEEDVTYLFAVRAVTTLVVGTGLGPEATTIATTQEAGPEGRLRLRSGQVLLLGRSPGAQDQDRESHKAALLS
jgi:hypothetical protein